MRHLLFSLIFFCLFSFFGCAHKKKEILKVEKLQNNVYVATDLKHHNSRVLIVKGEKGSVMIVSSPFENKGTEKMMKWVVGNLQPKKMIAINTHYHLDGTGGNPVYHKYGVETWASVATNLLSKEKGSSMLKGRKIELSKKEFELKKGKAFNFDGEQVEVIFPGHSHSQDHVAVFFKDRKILFGGCMIKPGKTLGYMGNANVPSWGEAMAQLQKLDFELIIAGHTQWGGRDLLTKTQQNIEKAKVKTIVR